MTLRRNPQAHSFRKGEEHELEPNLRIPIMDAKGFKTNGCERIPVFMRRKVWNVPGTGRGCARQGRAPAMKSMPPHRGFNERGGI